MEMLFTIMAGVLVGVLAARRKDEYEKIVSLCFAGGAATGLGLLWTLISGNTVGTSASFEWILVGIIGGIAGVVTQHVLNFVLNRIMAMIRASHHDETHETPHQV